jgi:WD40 repeat protein
MLAIGTVDGTVVLTAPHSTVAPLDLELRAGRTIGAISALRFIADSIVAVTSRGEIRVWDRSSGRLRAVRDGLPALGALACNDAGTRLAVGGAGGRILVLDLADLATSATLVLHESTVTALDWRDEYVVSGDASGRVAVWRPQS